MFSSRLDWGAPPNRLSLALEARRAAGSEILDLTESNPTHAGIDYPAAPILDAFANHRSLVYEPSPAGHIAARQAISGYYSSRGLDVAPNRILVTASTSESYGFLFKLLADPGDEVLVPRPSYPLFEFLAALESVQIRHYPLRYHGRWWLDTEAVAAAITPRTRAIILVNPNNPTGSYLKRTEVDALASLARRHSLALIADEVFSDFPLSPAEDRIATLADFDAAPAFALSGLSKIAGMPQMKLGWMAVAGPARFRSAAYARLELIADTYLSTGTPVQHAAQSLIEVGRGVRNRISARTRENLAVLRMALAAAPACEILDVEGGWYAALRLPRTRTEEEYAIELLDRDGVLVQPGYFYDFETEAFLVVSLLTEPRAFHEGSRRLAARLSEA